VQYVSPLKADGSGQVVPTRGGAVLEVVVFNEPAPGAPVAMVALGGDLAPVRGFRTMRQVAMAGVFEGNTTLGLGVRSRLPFRVFALEGGPGGGSRLVIDVAHRWCSPGTTRC
jgi:hypothetical protein